jgi:hypothetical protein
MDHAFLREAGRRHVAPAPGIPLVERRAREYRKSSTSGRTSRAASLVTSVVGVRVSPS